MTLRKVFWRRKSFTMPVRYHLTTPTMSYTRQQRDVKLIESILQVEREMMRLMYDLTN